MLPVRKQGHPTPAGQKHPVKGKIQRTNTQGRPPSQAAAGRESTQEQGQPIRPRRTASALPRDKKKKIIFPKWQKNPKKRGVLCPYCEIKNFQKIIIFTIQPHAPYSKGEQKKRHVNGPDDVTSTDRGRNSYALHREPSETLTHLCKKSICTIFAKCKQFCAKRDYKSTKSTDRTDSGARTASLLFVWAHTGKTK